MRGSEKRGHYGIANFEAARGGREDAGRGLAEDAFTCEGAERVEPRGDAGGEDGPAARGGGEVETARGAQR